MDYFVDESRRAEIAQLDRQSEELAAKCRSAADDKERAALRKKLEPLLAKIFDLRQSLLEKEIAKQRQALDAHKKDKSQLLKFRLEELTKPQPKP